MTRLSDTWAKRGSGVCENWGEGYQAESETAEAQDGTQPRTQIPQALSPKQEPGTLDSLSRPSSSPSVAL